MSRGATSHITLSSCCVEYYASDDASKKALVILGGNPSDIRDFDMIKPALEQEYRVILLNWPGFGGPTGTTFESGEEEGGVLFFYQVLVEFLEALRISRALYIGINVGAIVACRLAIDFPILVERLALVCPCGFAPQKHWLTSMSGRFAPSVLSEAKRCLGHKETSIIKQMLERAASIQSSPVATRVIQQVWKSIQLSESSLVDRVAAINAPVLLVFGKNDPIVSPTKDGTIAKKAFGEAAKGVIVLDCRSAPHAEIPDQLISAILPFLSDDYTLL